MIFFLTTLILTTLILTILILLGFVLFYFYTTLILLNKYAMLINKKNMLYQLIYKEVSDLVILDKTCDHVLMSNKELFTILTDISYLI